MSDTRCIDGRLMRHDPQNDDPYLETDIGKCHDCGGKGCVCECCGEPLSKTWRGDLSAVHPLSTPQLKGTVMQYNCECGHFSTEHPAPKRRKDPRPCTNEDCTCRNYNWDEDRGGHAVTRSKFREPKPKEPKA